MNFRAPPTLLLSEHVHLVSCISNPILLVLHCRYPFVMRYSIFVVMFIICLAPAMSSFCTTTGQLIVARGVTWAGTGFASIFFPFLKTLLQKTSYKTTLRVLVCFLFVLTAPVVFFVKTSVPASANSQPQPISWRFLRSRFFNIHQACSTIVALSFFFPLV